MSMIYCLNKQHLFLSKKHNCGLFYLDLKDIVVIDSSIFVCINPMAITNITSVGDFSFYSPFSRNSKTAFFSPELLALDKIPSAVDCKCFYYSLGALAIYCLFGKHIKGLDSDEIQKLLIPIYQTKLYWMLLKALEYNYERRSFIYI
jgi:serine/threonine protein kinase